MYVGTGTNYNNVEFQHHGMFQIYLIAQERFLVLTQSYFFFNFFLIATQKLLALIFNPV